MIPAFLLLMIRENGLFTAFAGDNLADVPQVGNSLLSGLLFFFVLVFDVDGMSAAVCALNLDTPAAFGHDQTGTAADRAFVKKNQFIHCIDSLLSKDIVFVVKQLDPAAAGKIRR